MLHRCNTQHNSSRAKAERQGRAIRASQARRKRNRRK